MAVAPEKTRGVIYEGSRIPQPTPTLLHVPQDQTVTGLGEMRRVLRPSGHLALVTALGHGARLETVP